MYGCGEVARTEQLVRKGKVLGKLHIAVAVALCMLYTHTCVYYTVVTCSRKLKFDYLTVL